MHTFEPAFPSANACLSRLQMKSKGLAAICRNIRIIPNAGISTARICLRGRTVSMEISPSFWDRISEDDRTFVLAHEAFHVALGHINRGKGYPQQVMNVAADAVTNDWLLHELDLKTSPQLQSQMVTMDSVGLESGSALSMEHVMSLLQFTACMEALKGSIWASEHVFVREGSADEAIRDIMRSLSDAERQDIGWSPHAMNARKEELRHVSMNAANTIMKMLVAGRHGRKSAVQHTWAREPRRMSEGLLVPDSDEVRSATGCHVRFYLDSSGSMGGLEDMLLGCADELENNDVTVSKFWFDTKVHPSEKRFLFGGGGTDFGCISSHAASHAQFDLAVVITDGYAPRAEVHNGHKWLWLITEGGSHHAVGHLRWKPISWAFRQRKASR
jgi:hypothetical protein